VLSRWQGGSGGSAGPVFVVGLLGVKVEDSRTRGAVGRQQGATGTHNLRALREGVQDWCDGFGDRCAGSSSIVSLFPCDKHV
jgi:hypothetical protein